MGSVILMTFPQPPVPEHLWFSVPLMAAPEGGKLLSGSGDYPLLYTLVLDIMSPKVLCLS